MENGLFDISSAHSPATLDSLLETDARVVRASLGSAAENSLPAPPPGSQTLPAGIADAFRLRTRLPAPGVYLLRNAVLRYRLVVTLDGRLVTGGDYLPRYYLVLIPPRLASFESEAGERPTRRIREPVYVPSLWGYSTYGHFLTELLPRMLLLRELYARGLRFPVLVPPAEFLPEAFETFAPELELEMVDSEKVKLELDQCLLPVDGSVNLAFHPETATRIDAAVNGLRSRRDSGRRLFVSRLGFRAARGKDFRVLENEAELQDIARERGLEIVEPQELSLRDQAVLFSEASLLVGEASSALHNAIFASGSRVISLGWVNNLQTMIAGLRSHRLSYLLPERMVWAGEPVALAELGENRRFSIDPDLLVSALNRGGDPS